MSRRLVNIADLQQFTAVELLSDPGHDPSPKPIPQCMEVRFDYALPDSKTAHNVLHARYPSAYPGSVAMANTIKAAWSQLFGTSGLNNNISTQVTLAGVSLRDLGVLNAVYITSTGAASAIGIDPSQAMPAEVAAVLTERTPISGPGGRGRIYIGGFTPVAIGPGNTISASCVAQLTSFANGISGVFTASSVTQCLALPSRVAYTGTTGRQHPARAAQTADVIATVVRDNHWDSQRRRGLK